MSVEENKATIRRVIDELSRGNVSIVDQAFSPDFAFHAHTHADEPLRGLQGARTMVTSSALSEVRATIEDIFGEGDRVAVRWTFRGVYRGEARPGFPAPGRAMHGGRDLYVSVCRWQDRRRLGCRGILERK